MTSSMETSENPFLLKRRFRGFSRACRAYVRVNRAPIIRSKDDLEHLLRHGFTQKINIVFPGFCKLNNSFGDSLISKIAFVAKLKSCASHFECDAHDALGLGVEFGTIQKLSYRHALPLPSLICSDAHLACQGRDARESSPGCGRLDRLIRDCVCRKLVRMI